MPTISLPNNWQPRWYQRPLWDYLEKGGKRAIAIWHRRAGKDEVILHRTAVSSFERVGNRWHCLPEYEQARKAIWESVNPHTGKRRIDEAFPPELRERVDSQAMFIQFKNGSTWQLIGSDRYNATVGSAPVEITYSEFALANPSAWAYHRPMLEENNGVASFITTPRGNNHARALFDMASRTPGWFAQRLTVEDTGVLTAEQLEASLAEYQALYGLDFGRAMFEQEYLCSFSGAMVGAYWGAEVNKAEREGRIQPFEIDPQHPVHTAWDLGKAVNNPIWCFQVIAGRPVIVDFYQPESDDLADWVKWLDDKGYKGTDYVPHDIIATEWGSKRTRLETLQGLGRRPKRLPMVSVADGLQAGRVTINAAIFRDVPSVQDGLDGLRNYRREWDDERKTFRETPVKDWAEHRGSAFRYLSLAWKEVIPPTVKEKQPDKLIYEVRPDGRVVGNMDVKAAVEAMMRRKRKR